MDCGDVNRERGRSGSCVGTEGQTSVSGFNAAFRCCTKLLFMAPVAEIMTCCIFYKSH